MNGGNKLKSLNRRIENYWNERSKNFSKNRRMELSGKDSSAWKNIFIENLPKKNNLKILDVGTGAGFFSIILSKLGHKVTGVDMSEKMILEAEKNSAEFNCKAEFYKMDAQNLNFADESFDVIVTRNLTWTLPNVTKAYREWHRVLKKGGMLINFDSDYGNKDFTNEKTCVRDSKIEKKLLLECQEIKNSMQISMKSRPHFDVEFLKTLNFSVDIEKDISARVRKDKNLQYDSVEMFAIYAKKIA